MCEVNLNQYVNVTLNDLGLRLWQEGSHRYEHVTQGGNLRTQLRCLMQVFGPHLFNGCDMPFASASIQVEPQ